MEVSIIIINYNTFELTSRCLKSLYEHNNGFSFEIILVDNNSSECNPDLFLVEFPSIKLIKSKENVGFSKGNNLGICQATGEYILLLNSDTELLENSIKRSLDYAETLPSFGVLSCKLVYPDDQHQSVAQRFPSIRLRVIELFRIHKLLPKKRAGKLLLGAFFDHNENAEVDWVWGAFFLFRQSSLEVLTNKKLNDDYFMYYEDIQWCLDFKKKGLKIYYYAETKVLHKMGGSSANKTALMATNKELFMKNNYSTFKIEACNLLDKCLSKLA